MHHNTQSAEYMFTMQWNIERGYKLDNIVQELKHIDADVIALQEVDIGCERSDSIDTGTLPAHVGVLMSGPLSVNKLLLLDSRPAASSVISNAAGKHIAEALGLNYVFFCEFEELHSPLRSKALQVPYCMFEHPTCCQKACGLLCLHKQNPEAKAHLSMASTWRAALHACNVLTQNGARMAWSRRHPAIEESLRKGTHKRMLQVACGLPSATAEQWYM